MQGRADNDAAARTMRCVTMKPPVMLTAEASTAAAAIVSAAVVGIRPLLSSTKPPTAEMPLMALVTDMSGECSAGLTDQTL
jgi:hypothetical protein